MARRAISRFSLKRKLIRCSWNPQNLYNIATKPKINPFGRASIYQQKWLGKRESRAYHGEHLRERQLLNQIDLSLFKKYSAYHARTTALEKPPLIYSQVYAILERRLDVAVFRALFASSIYQAKQMILTRKVKVNGQPVTKPHKELEPGDIFSVEPVTVMKSVLQLPIRSNKSEPINWAELGQLRFVAKDYMSPFAFVPEYLQVSYNICSAVYVRHPQIQHGRAEIPSPANEDLLFKAFSYYVLRRSTRQGFARRRKQHLPVNWGAEREYSPVNYAEIFDSSNEAFNKYDYTNNNSHSNHN